MTADDAFDFVWKHLNREPPFDDDEIPPDAPRRSRREELPRELQLKVIDWEAMQHDRYAVSVYRVSIAGEASWVLAVSTPGDERWWEVLDEALRAVTAAATPLGGMGVLFRGGGLDPAQLRSFVDPMSSVPGPRRTVSGRLTRTGAPVVDAPVRLRHHPSNGGRATLTDADGRFRFDHVPPGELAFFAKGDVELDEGQAAQ